MTIECTELQGETLAFHFICGIFCLIGWGSWVSCSRRTYGDRTICMDWHRWCPTVCLCVSQWANLLDMPLWRLTWQVCMARKMRILRANMTWARRKFNIYCTGVHCSAQVPRRLVPRPVNIVFIPCCLEWMFQGVVLELQMITSWYWYILSRWPSFS